MAANDTIKVWVLVSFYDENGLHKAGSVAYVKEEEFNPNYMKKIEGGGGGSTVEVTQVQTTGTKIATIKVDEDSTDLYAPEGSGGGSVIDNITVDSDTDVVTDMNIDDETYHFCDVRVVENSENLIDYIYVNNNAYYLSKVGSVEKDDEDKVKSMDINGAPNSFTSIENISTQGPNGEVDSMDINGSSYNFATGGSVIENISTQGPNGEVDSMDIDGQNYAFATGGSVIENIDTQGPNGEVSQMDIDNQTYTFYTGSGIDELVDLDDVAVSSPSNGQVLTYNSTSQKWENANAGGGGGGSSLVVTLTGAYQGVTIELASMAANASISVSPNKTYAEIKAADDIIFKIVDTTQAGSKYTLRPTGMQTLNVAADQSLIYTFSVITPSGDTPKVFKLEIGPWGTNTFKCIS